MIFRLDGSRQPRADRGVGKRSVPRGRSPPTMVFFVARSGDTRASGCEYRGDTTVRCSKCEFDNPAGMRFCGKCRTALALTCPNCAFENPPGFDFCGQCAAALGHAAGTAKREADASKPAATVRFVAEEEAQPTLDGERKSVTALFADIKGSMDLIEDIDPEEARAIVDPALKLMIDAANRYDGYIVQSTGDGIFALFGAPVAHEDHPQRALYAALRMQEDLKRYADKLREQGQPPLLVRVGVNTGEVVVRSIRTGDAHTEYTPIGHSMSLASRLQTLAAPGSVVIGQSVQKFVEGYFQLKALGASRIKGVSEPVNVLRGDGARTAAHAVAALGGTRTDQVRRARARDGGAQACRRPSAKRGHGQIVAAMAEPGVGKSRLYFEFKATAKAGWMVLEAFSVSHGKASAYLPVIDLLQPISRSRARTTRASGAKRSPASRWRWTARWKTRCLMCSACWASSRARNRWRRWTRSSEAAHARGDQTDPAARELESAADGDLRRPALDRRGDPGVPQSASGLDWDREDFAAGELPSANTHINGATRLTTRSCGSTRSARKAPRRCSRR